VTALGGALGAAISTLAYALGRSGLLMFGSSFVFIPAIFVLPLGFTRQAGAIGWRPTPLSQGTVAL
jgi:hypothetical protein